MTTSKTSVGTTWCRVKDVLLYAVGQIRTVKKVYPGIMHTMIFWGVTIQILGTVVKMLQMGLFVPFTLPLLPQNGYFAYELVMDLAGVAIILGVGMAAVRRAFLRPWYMETSWDDIYVLILLFLLPSVGFVTEGLRMLSFQPAWGEWAPVGQLAANAFRSWGISPQTADAVHPYFFWGHVGIGLTFFASIPFTKLRHLLATPIHIFSRTDRETGEVETIQDLMEAEVLGATRVQDFSSLDLLSFDACLQCGRCEEVCPATISGMPYSPRTLLLELREEMAASLLTPQSGSGESLSPNLLEEETLWACTACGACLDVCPAFIRPPERVIDMRRAQVLMTGEMPSSVGETLRNIERQGNPWGIPAAEKTKWARGLDVPVLTPGDEVDVLFFVGCAAAFDDHNQKAARAFVRLLNRLEIDYGILGPGEMCCGETARRMGNEYLFQVFAEDNIAALEEIQFQRIVTQCPHGYNTLRNEYPRFGGHFKVQHSTEFLSEYQDQLKALSQENGSSYGTITYHDSCYLGRYNKVYDPPRQLMKSVRLEPVEMRRTKADSFCCGGGGGGMWVETDAETRINHERLKDIQAAGADTVASACPFCTIMLEDALRSKGMMEEVRILDIAEVLDAQVNGS